MVINKRVSFKHLQGRKPKELLWWCFGRAWERRFSGLSVYAYVNDGKARVVGSILGSKGEPAASCSIRLPGEPDDLRELGKMFLDLADEIDKERTVQNVCNT